MSLDVVQQVIGRAITDVEFCQQLIEDARSACADYELTDDELDALDALDAESLKAFAGTLDPRLSKSAGRGFI
ncbi:Franean1_4349 family RiPP [Candidatus Chloroploca sp. Khr17]|uniref:Franean1_4349 family RiPP n=1 Tax=Candidatus Chloroploca sp. Khr17 TaxID=2496869 RepID=UPI00101C9E30|nr:Franean1_4349 family RiPP [Candidatus Chloroploca sp. Khr17]